jgi:hypothetical protein
MPWYDVILRWNDISGENHFLLDMRDTTTGISVYENLYIVKDSTSVTIPKSKLINGHEYRWFLRSVDDDGNKGNAPVQRFRIEYGINNQGIDSHLWGTTYASASHIDYFISAPSNIDSILQTAVNSWNNISSKVYLHRDYSDTTKELGIYGSSNPPNQRIWGRTFPGGSAYFDVNEDDPYDELIVSFTEIVIYHTNIANYGGGDRYRKTMLHETGHALGLAHTNGSDYGYSPYVPAGNRIDVVDSDINSSYTSIIPLVMNSGDDISYDITDVDKAHLKIKWGK